MSPPSPRIWSSTLRAASWCLEDIWINILPEGGIHTSHIHPHSVISGTTYVQVPPGAKSIKLEDPRHAMMMAAPARKKDAREELRAFVYPGPEEGDVLLWESWLRHEVPMNMDEDDRVSVSFNYRWERSDRRNSPIPPTSKTKMITRSNAVMETSRMFRLAKTPKTIAEIEPIARIQPIQFRELKKIIPIPSRKGMNNIPVGTG
jgi:hypothetical protein